MYVVWIGVALLLAAAVFVVASVAERGENEARGVRGFLRDFRAGLSRRQRSAPAPAPVDTDMDDFFAANLEVAPGYVDADELGQVLHRAQARVTGKSGPLRPE